MSTTDDLPPRAETFTIDPPQDVLDKHPGQESLQVTENAFEFVYEPLGWTRSGAQADDAELELDDETGDDEDAEPAPPVKKATAKKATRRTGPPPPSS